MYVVDVGSVGDSRLVCVRKRRSGGEARCCRRPVGCFRCQAFLRCVRALAVELLGESIRPRRRPAKLHPALTVLGIASRLRSSTTNCSPTPSSRLFLYQREQYLDMVPRPSFCRENGKNMRFTLCNAYVMFSSQKSPEYSNLAATYEYLDCF